MRIYHNNLSATLNQGFKPVWLIFGDEPWQKNDSLATIKNTYLQQGFDEIIRFTADDKFDWSNVTYEYQSMSLFSSQRIIEIEIISGKVNETASKALIALSEQFNNDIILIIHGAKLDAAQQKKKWFKTFENLGCFLPLYDIEGKQLHQWLNRQIKQLNLNIHPDVLPLMIELFEGNLLALDQELQKLSILFGQNLITIQDAEKIIINQAKFNPFQVIDTLLIGNLKKCVSILDQLQHEGAPIGQLVWFMHKEISQLIAMQERLKQGESINDLYKFYRIWDKKKPLYQNALNNMSMHNLQQGLSRLAQVDLISKTASDFNPYLLLSDVCITLYFGQTTSNLPLDYEYS
ncbi:DNA polymerase III subunit delta [Pseudocolwellia agarivorans]|uniref:DNA polymerase III subunit delta n=1 Tax=Pseudocolwellia agarivorans TaxID=1911682 RepID=UPI000987111E|nr:DNA polymerase III subunit delta [Pseudocolwellia agarivorans]